MMLGTVDMIHVSGGGDGVLTKGHHPAFGAGYQVGLADKIKKATDLPVIAVGMLDDALVADFVLESQQADLVAIGRGLLRDPHWWLNAQQRLGLTAQQMQDLPPSYARGY
ncbi:hypothetical protein [uncultured Moraxella sp.]|uniref:oxidoreductase n=1 Tax=uncultured Moraxella sp. TaxID=263769 RepID=UPI0025D98E9F|nr:hypothetical protein [uncultured Moraxella sp.]